MAKVVSRGKRNRSKSKSSVGTKAPVSSAPKSIKDQVSDIAKQGQLIQDTFNKIKGNLTASDRAKIGAGLTQATSKVSSLVKSGSVARATGTPLPKTTVPDTAAAVTAPAAPYVPPATTPATGDVTFAEAGLAGMQAFAEAQKQAELQRAEALKQQQEATKESWLKDMISPKAAREQAMEDTGIDVGDYFADQEKGFKEIESLTNSYNRVVEAKDQQLAATQDKMASMNFINNQSQQIERNAAPQLNRLSADINAKTAVLEAQQGNFAEAQKYVNQAVQDATAENKFRYDMFQTTYEMNKDNFDRIDSIYSDAYTEQMGIAKMEYETQLAEKEMIGKLLLEYPTAGIDIYSDSLNEAYKKAGVTAAIPKSTGSFSSQDLSRANQVLSGMAALSDFTTAEQANVRDAIFSMNTAPDWYKSQLEGERLQSVDPTEVQRTWDDFRLQVSGPGTGFKAEAVGSLTGAQASEAINYLYASGATPADIEKFQTDRDFQAWAYAKSQE